MSARFLKAAGLMPGRIPISPVRGEQKMVVRVMKLASVRRDLAASSLPQKILRARALLPCAE